MVIAITEQNSPSMAANTCSFFVYITPVSTVHTMITNNPDVVYNRIENLWTHQRTKYLSNTLVIGIAVQPAQLNLHKGATLTLCCSQECIIIPLWRTYNGSHQFNLLLNNPQITFVCATDLTDIRVRLLGVPLARDMGPHMLLDIRRYFFWLVNESVAQLQGMQLIFLASWMQISGVNRVIGKRRC